MKTAIVLSDTHGNRRAIDEIEGILSESDYIIHLGDTSGDGSYIRSRFPDKTYLVNGNCDPVKLGEDEVIVEIEGVKLIAVHGHRLSVKSNTDRLLQRAKELGCALALYGHTHTAKEEFCDGVALVNPGAFSRFSQKSYLYIVFNNGKFTQKIVLI